MRRSRCSEKLDAIENGNRSQKRIEKEPNQSTPKMATIAAPAPSTSSSLSSSSVLVLADDRDVLGEGPVHDPRVGKLYRVDIEGKKVLSIELKETAGGEGGEKEKEGGKASPSPSVVVGETPEAVGCLALTSDPKTLLVALSRSVYSLNAVTGELSDAPLATLDEREGVEGLRFNDGKVSPKGAFVIGRLHSKWRDGEKGAVYCLRKEKSDSSWSLERVLGPEEVGMGNGMAWRKKREGENEKEGEKNGDEKDEELFDFFIVDSAAKTVQRFQTDKSTAVPISGTGEIVLDASDFQNNVPDGMEIDSSGKLWVALAETGTVVRFDPEAKSKGLPLSRLATLRLPLTRVTSCAFGVREGGGAEGEGGEDFSSTLFVTSREEASKLKEEASPVAGSVLIVSDVAGAARMKEKVGAGCAVAAVVEL